MSPKIESRISLVSTCAGSLESSLMSVASKMSLVSSLVATEQHKEVTASAAAVDSSAADNMEQRIWDAKCAEVESVRDFRRRMKDNRRIRRAMESEKKEGNLRALKRHIRELFFDQQKARFEDSERMANLRQLACSNFASKQVQWDHSPVEWKAKVMNGSAVRKQIGACDLTPHRREAEEKRHAALLEVAKYWGQPNSVVLSSPTGAMVLPKPCKATVGTHINKLYVAHRGSDRTVVAASSVLDDME